MGYLSQSLGLLPAALAALLLSSPPCGAQGRSLWSIQSDGTWEARQVSLGDHGGQVFTPPGPYADHFWVHSTFAPASAVLEEPITAWADYPKVSSSAYSDVHVGVYQQRLVNEPWIREPVICKFDSGQTAPRWTYVSPARIHSHPLADVAVSDDGAVIVFVVFDESGVTKMSILTPADGGVIAQSDVEILGPYVDFRLSGDGSTALLVSSYEFVVVDVPTLSKIHGHVLSDGLNFHTMAICHDGSRIAYGIMNQYRVYDRQPGNTYAMTFSTGYLGPGDIQAIDISKDGSRVASVLHAGNETKSNRIAIRDIDTNAVLMEDVLTYTGDYANDATALSMDDDGERFAVGFLGDEDGRSLELLVYCSSSSEPIFSYDLPGSVLDLDLAPDGTHLAVASLDRFAGEQGAKSRIDCFEIGSPDLTLHGVPHTGTTVTFKQAQTQRSVCRVLWSPAPADPPVTFDAGTLYLQRGGIQLLDTGQQAVGVAEFETPYTILDAPGTSLYFQGIDLGTRKLSDNYIKMTVLP